MEKAQQQQMKSSLVWDCGSSLYDSFELKSIEHQLHSAIVTSRTLSMPHLSSHSKVHQPRATNKRSSPSSPFKIYRSIHKFIRLVFRSKTAASGSLLRVEDGEPDSQDKGFYALYDQSGSASGGLSTIPEVPEMGFDLLPRRIASQRFTSSTSLGISCT